MNIFLIALIFFFTQTSLSMQQQYTDAEQTNVFTTFLKRQKPTNRDCEILRTLLPEIHAEVKKNKFTTEQACALYSLLCHAERYLPEDKAYIQEITTPLNMHISPPNLKDSESILCKRMHKVASLIFAASAVLVGTYLLACFYQTEKAP